MSEDDLIKIRVVLSQSLAHHDGALPALLFSLLVL